MHVKAAKLKLRLSTTESLKDKRRILKSLIARTKQEHHIAISEVDSMDNIREAVLGLALVCNDARLNESILRKVINAIEKHPEIEIEAEQIEEIHL